MANIFINLPAPAGNGSGAWTDVSTMGAEKTIVVGGTTKGTVTIEVSNEAVASKAAAVKSFTAPGEVTVTVAAKWMRATVTGYSSGGAPEVDMGANDDGASILNIVPPAGNGTGAAANSSALPLTKTITVGGPFKGTVIIEVSEDAGVTWGTLTVFTNPGLFTSRYAASRMRVVRSGIAAGVTAGTPLVNVAACQDTSTAPAFTNLVVTTSFEDQGRLLLSGDLTPAALAANQNDYAPAGFATAYTLRLAGTAARTITGIAGGAGGRRIRLLNIGAFPLTFTSLDAASAAANRFTFPGAASVIVAPLGSMELQYDATQSLWKPVQTGASVLAPDGLAANPGMRFASEATGWYLVAAGFPGFVVGGSLFLHYTAGGGFPLWTTDNLAGIENGGGEYYSGTISPAQIAANTNDYAPAGARTARNWRLTTDAARDLTGIVPSGAVNGQEIVIMNVGAQNLTLKDENAGSAAANRFALVADIVLAPDASATLWYDATTTRWRCTGKS